MVRRSFYLDDNNSWFYLLGGGDDGDEGIRLYADILEYSDKEGEEKWTGVGEMSVPRLGAAVSVVSYDDYKNHCQ